MSSTLNEFKDSWSGKVIFLCMDLAETQRYLYFAHLAGLTRVLTLFGMASTRNVDTHGIEAILHQVKAGERGERQGTQSTSCEECFIEAIVHGHDQLCKVMDDFDIAREALHVCLGGFCLPSSIQFTGRKFIDPKHDLHYSGFVHLEDKILCSRLFKELGLPTPQTLIIDNDDVQSSVRQIDESLGNQTVVLSGCRAERDHFGQLVFIADTPSSLLAILQEKLCESKVIRAAEFVQGPILNCHGFVFKHDSSNTIQSEFISVEESIVLFSEKNLQFTRCGPCSMHKGMLSKEILHKLESSIANIGFSICKKYGYEGWFNVDAILASNGSELNFLEINFRPGGRAGNIFWAYSWFIEVMHYAGMHKSVGILVELLRIPAQHREFMFPIIRLPCKYGFFNPKLQHFSKIHFGYICDDKVVFVLDPQVADFKAEICFMNSGSTEISVQFLPWGKLQQRSAGWMSDNVEIINNSLLEQGAVPLVSVCAL